ncbi:hypothetical protein E1265_09605 [Streptomyces sp. 8K308]|uniref:hypothetical protein n=1 Tax=Streptomyces sp. 8K308 TaxID=2530388 RepID=UPI00104C2DD0|nr:hypothetical protein [Streptomyces sp. 8K308]TDC24483.1 hypothetical protein E1265_09605 [Streptomyces sp. 8K308]
MTAADPIARLKAAKRRFDRLRAQLPEREARRNSLLADSHVDPLSEEEKQEREARRARGEKNPPVPGRGRRTEIARLIDQTERNVRNIHEAELAYREATNRPRRLAEPDAAFAELPEAQRAVDEVIAARDAYYAAIAHALPPRKEGARVSGADADRFGEVRETTGLDPSHLRRIQRAVLEGRTARS